MKISGKKLRRIISEEISCLFEIEKISVPVKWRVKTGGADIHGTKSASVQVVDAETDKEVESDAFDGPTSYSQADQYKDQMKKKYPASTVEDDDDSPLEDISESKILLHEVRDIVRRMLLEVTNPTIGDYYVSTQGGVPSNIITFSNPDTNTEYRYKVTSNIPGHSEPKIDSVQSAPDGLISIVLQDAEGEPTAARIVKPEWEHDILSGVGDPKFSIKKFGVGVTFTKV